MENLRQEIYKKQFFEYDSEGSCEKANEVLIALERLDSNPLLLQFVVNNLKPLGLNLKPLYYIEVTQTQYGENFTTVFDKVFTSILEAKEYAENGKFPQHLMFELYSIKEIK